MCFLRLLEIVFFLYFASHIPITALFDTQAVQSDLGIPKEWYPEEILNLTKQYVVQFKDPYLLDPPSWFKVFTLSEIIFQFPFFLVASYAFLMGSRPWIRTPAIIYSTHVATTVAAILYSIAFDDFSKQGRVGPVTQEERLRLGGVYAFYFFIPLLLLLTMLMSHTYTYGPRKVESKSSSQPKSKATGQQKRKQHLKSH